MSASTFIQILIILQAFIAGALAVIAAQHAYAHYKSTPPEPIKNQPPQEDFQLSPQAKEHILKSSQAHFEAVLNNSATKLQSDLGVTVGHINNLVLRLASEIVSNELERYRSDLTKLHEQAKTNIGGISDQIVKHQAEIEAKINQELEAEKQRLVKQIDTKLADAVGSFLSETLQHNVDLGSQSSYLLEMLDSHKDDFIKEVGSANQNTYTN